MDRFGQTQDYDLTARSREVRTNTFAKALNVNLLGKINLSNLFGGYKGEPRTFEVSALYGFGWGKGFGKYNRWDQGESGFYGSDLAEGNATSWGFEAAELFGNDGANELNSKAALNFALNLGAAKAVQIFVEPSITYSGLKDFKYNINRSTVQLNAGVVYKFKNSNGTHNFKLARLYDQDEIDRLNGIINAGIYFEGFKNPQATLRFVFGEARESGKGKGVINSIEELFDRTGAYPVLIAHDADGNEVEVSFEEYFGKIDVSNLVSTVKEKFLATFGDFIGQFDSDK
jgi:hypothetical protein